MLNKKILIIATILFGIALILFSKQIKTSISFMYSVILNKNIELKKEGDGSINVLLLGKGGGNHEGPDLTDTLMLANVNPVKKTIHLISIPRDLWVPSLSQKINTAYSIGQSKDKKGILLSRAAAQQVTGNQIDYVVVLDFSGFVKLVDYLGGVDVDVKRVLDDPEYPIDGKENDTCGHKEEELKDLATFSSQLDAFPCRYKKIHFDSGLQHMNGQNALEFVRSRHALDDEGSDFSRSQRQQEVISAVQRKIFSLGTILNPVKILGIYNILSENIDSDIATNEFDDFVKLAQKMKGAKITSVVLDSGDEEKKRVGLLVNPDISEKQNYEWVLIPRKGDGDFSEIKEYIGCIEKGMECLITDKGIQTGDINE